MPPFDPDVLKRSMLSFLAWPCVIGFVMGVNQVGFAQYLSFSQSVVFWLGLSLIIWTGLYVVTITFVKIWPRHPVPLIILTVPAALVASIGLKPIVFWYADLAAHVAATNEIPRAAPSFTWTISYFGEHFTAWSAVIVLWVITNVVWKSLLQYDFYGLGDVETESVGLVAAPIEPSVKISPSKPMSVAAQAFLKRIRHIKLADVIALSSEDHFVHIHLSDRNIMIYGGLSDAIEALHENGLVGVRVHRSHWVVRTAVTAFCSSETPMKVRLSNGVYFPVSRSYREVVRLSGLFDRSNAV